MTPIGFLLRTLDRLIDERFEQALGSVTRRQWQLLNALAEGNASRETLTAAVRPFLAEGESVDGHLEPLRRKGVVAGYTLTEPGRAVFTELARQVQTVRDRTVAGLPDGAYRRTVATLEAMIDNLRQDIRPG